MNSVITIDRPENPLVDGEPVVAAEITFRVEQDDGDVPLSGGGHRRYVIHPPRRTAIIVGPRSNRETGPGEVSFRADDETFVVVCDDIEWAAP